MLSVQQVGTNTERSCFIQGTTHKGTNLTDRLVPVGPLYQALRPAASLHEPQLVRYLYFTQFYEQQAAPESSLLFTGSLHEL